MILLMGIAGSGKGTQAGLLKEKYQMNLITMGDILRQYATGEIQQKLMNGYLLDDDEVIAVIDKVFNTFDIKNQETLVDGFPRTIPQAEWLIDQVNKGRFDLKVAIHLVASKDAVKRRLLKRARKDDHDSAIEARFNEYERQTRPLIDWLNEHGVKVVNVKAEQSIESVNQEIIKILETLN